jgi:hypothetical protein
MVEIPRRVSISVLRAGATLKKAIPLGHHATRDRSEQQYAHRFGKRTRRFHRERSVINTLKENGVVGSHRTERSLIEIGRNYSDAPAEVVKDR